MRITTALKAATVALAVLAIAAPTVAQEDPGSRRVATSDPIIANLDFGGGSLESFVKALRTAAGDNPMNIVYNPEAAGLPVAPITLQHVDAYTALRSVSQSMQITPMMSEDRRSIMLGIDRITGNGAPVYSIEVHEISPQSQIHPGQRGRHPQPPELHTAVHSISNLTSGPGAMSADDVLAAIQLGLEMDGKSDAKMSFHEETGLLFARVSHDQANAIEMTIVHLRQSLNARQQSESRSQLEAVLDATGTRSIDELAGRVRGTDALRQQVADLQRTVRDLENLVEQLKADLDAARRQ